MAKDSPDYVISYAQNREDRIIEAFFPDVDKGFYVDVGANHPFYHSVTKIFYDKGWKGINVEPNPMLFKQISQQRKRDTNLMIGIGSQEGMLDLRIYHSSDGLEGISTLSSDMKDDYSSNQSSDTMDFDDLNIEIKTLKQIFIDNKVDHVHFIKIDVEGFEYEVLEGNDWKKYRPELICIESNHINKDWRPILANANYVLVFNDGLNDYYLAQESIKRRNSFDYAKVFLGNKPVLPFEVSEKIRSLEHYFKEVQESASKQILELTDSLKVVTQQLDKSRAHIEEITPLRKHIKRQINARTKNRLSKGKKTHEK